METLAVLIEQIQRNKSEDQTLEIKAAHEGTPRLYETLSSFSNQAEGGIIVLGVDEARGFECVGVHSAQQIQIDIANQCKEMVPEIRPTFSVGQIGTAAVVAVHVVGLPIAQRPAYRKTAGIANGSFSRVGESDLRMTQQELFEIEAYKNSIRHDKQADPSAKHDMLDQNLVVSYIKRAKAERPRLGNRTDEEILRLTGAEQNQRPTLAGLIALGDYPQQVYPNLCLTAIAVPGTEIRQDESRERFSDDKRFEGPLLHIVEDALGFIRRNTKTSITVKDGKRTEGTEYPESAVREIIINAFAHRDYGPYSIGSPVRLVIYSNRLECWNPGGIYGGQPVESLGYENIQTRNPTLVTLLETQGVIENRHSGIPSIRDAMEQVGLLPPVFEDRRGGFTATLYNAKGFSGGLAEGGKGPQATEDAILAYCRIPRSRHDIAAYVNRNVDYVSHAFLNPMVKQGKLAYTVPEKPRSKKQQYVATE